MAYLEIPAAKQKIIAAKEEQSNILITAPTGYGKTSLIEQYYDNDTLWLNCLNGKISEMPDINSVVENTIVVDDLSFLTDEKGREYIKSIVANGKCQVILIGRADFPNWLSDTMVSYDFVRIWTKDLMFRREQVGKYLEGHGLTEEEITKITDNSIGYPIAIKFIKLRLDAGEKYVEDIMNVSVWDDVLHYFERTIFERIEPEILDMLLAMSPYDVFDVELAQAVVLTSENIPEWILYVRNIGSILQKVSDTEYSFEPHVRKYLIWKRDFEYSEQVQREQYRRAANYYEKHNDLLNALKYYKLSDNYDFIEHLLAKNSSISVGTGQYYELREYYLSIPEEHLYKSPNLMAAVSILYSMQLMPEKSEELYSRIREIEKSSDASPQLRKEAKSRLIWLDISLPHRCGKGMIGVLKTAALLIMKREIELPEFSPTSNMPSLMNGGLDMSEWSKVDKQLAKFIGKPLEIVLQEQGKGMVNVALAESGFEKNTMDSYEVLTRSHNGYSAAFSYGKFELCFAALAIIAKQHVLHEQLPSAKKNIDDFKGSFKLSENIMLSRNVDAFYSDLALRENSAEVAEKYLESAPDEKKEFYVLNRYLYMVKLKCLIATNQLTEAMNLSCILEEYFTNYNRTIFWIENRAYRAIILYRQKDGNWKTELESVFLKAQEYHFIRTLSLIGSPLLELISEWKPGAEVDINFLEDVLKEAKIVAGYYPRYLQVEKKIDISLTPQEERILKLLCQGDSLQDIADECNIKYNSVRVHTHNIYQKLGVASRTEAEHMAARLGIVTRR